MSKRARVEMAAARAGLRSSETLQGHDWLYKASNPSDTSIAGICIPSEENNNLAPLNWQSDYDISAPPSVSAQIPSFDVDLYLPMNPVLYGVSIASPSGTIDLSEIDRLGIAYQGTAAGSDGRVIITPAVAPERSVALRLCRQLVNTQLNAADFYANNSLAAKRTLWAKVSQKSRAVYGSALIIPTCSDLNNGGAISCCQQICQPRQSVLRANNNIMLNTYTDEDFPNVSDVAQNPQMYYARFADGCYVPYKLRNPANMPYVNSELQTTTRAPYCVTSVTAIGITEYTSATVFTVSERPLNFVPSTTSTAFTLSNTATGGFVVGANANEPMVLAIRFYIVSYTGQRGYIDYSLQTLTSLGLGTQNSAFYTNDSLSTPVTATNIATYLNEGGYTAGPDPANYVLSTHNAYTLLLPGLVTMFQAPGTLDLDNPVGSWYFSQDIAVGNTADPQQIIGTIPSNVSTNMTTVHMTGVSSTAPVRVYFRLGMELQITAGSLYSPFKMIKPAYDESSLKSYGRVTRVIRDAFFANAGISAGQADFIQRLRALIEDNSPEPISRILNQGGSFQGVIS